MLEYFTSFGSQIESFINQENFDGCTPDSKRRNGYHDHFTNMNNSNVSGNEVADNVVNNVAQQVGEAVNQVLNNGVVNAVNNAVNNVVNNNQVNENEDLDEVINNSVNNAIRNEVNEGAINEAVNNAVNNTVNNVKNAVDNLNNLNNMKNNHANNQVNNVAVANNKKVEGLDVLSLIVMLVVQVLPVVLIAVNCNPQNKLLHGILAFFFDRIYLFIHALVKYVFPIKGYCGNK